MKVSEPAPHFGRWEGVGVRRAAKYVEGVEAEIEW